MTEPRRRSDHTNARARMVRSYVLDTSVLLSDPHAMLRFAEHEVVVPVVVVVELEASGRTRSWATSPDKHCGCSMICGSVTAGSMSRWLWGITVARCAWS